MVYNWVTELFVPIHDPELPPYFVLVFGFDFIGAMLII